MLGNPATAIRDDSRVTCYLLHPACAEPAQAAGFSLTVPRVFRHFRLSPPPFSLLSPRRPGLGVWRVCADGICGGRTNSRRNERVL